MYATAKPITLLKEMDPATLGFTPISSIEPNRLYLLQQIAHYIGECELDTVRRKFIKTGKWKGKVAVDGSYLVSSNSVIEWVEADHE